MSEAQPVIGDTCICIWDGKAWLPVPSKRTYPSRHGPGSSPWATMAWSLLDQTPANQIGHDARTLLAGLVAGSLSEIYNVGFEFGGGKGLPSREAVERIAAVIRGEAKRA